MNNLKKMNIKGLIFGMVMCCVASTGLRAQKVIDTWSFSTGVDTTLWYDISGVDSMLIAPGNKTSARSGLVSIGFDFTLGETTHTQFSTNINGTVRLGNVQILSSGGYSNALNQSNGPKIEPFGYCGRFDSTCYTRMALLGTAGNRVLVVETRMKDYNNASDSLYLSFQVQLFEAGGLRIVYGESDPGAVYNTSFARLQNGVSASLNNNNRDIIYIDFATHEAVRLNSTCSLYNTAELWPEKGRWYNLEPDASPCPYPGNITVVSNNPDSTVLSWPAVAGANYHLMIAEAGLNTILTDTFICITGMLNGGAIYNGTLQTMCADGSESYRVREFSFTTGCGTVHQMPWIDDFQLAAGDNCWLKPYTTSARRWRRQSSGNNYFMRVPSGNSSTIYNEWLVSAPLVLPDTVGLTLGWWYKSSQISNVAPQVKVRLLVCDTSDDIDTSAAWVTLRTIGIYEQYSQQYYSLLDAWAGHRVRVAFQRVGQGGGYCDVDNVSVEVLTQPSVVLEAPTLVYGGDTVTVVSVLTRGVLANPQYVWHSTMEEQGLMLRTEDDDTLRLVYLASGLDTITLTLTTDYGTATATTVIDVVDCRAVTHFPWSEDFEHGYDCWSMPSSGPNVWDLRTTGAHGGQRVACATIHDTYNVYDTLISQPIALPTDAHGLTLSWWMRHDASADPSNYRRIWVKALNAANPVWSSGDSLLYRNSTGIPTSWQQFSVDLEPLAGQTVRLAFVGSSYYSGKYIYIDDIEIRYTREPVVSLATSSERLYGEDTVTAAVTLTEGDTVGISYLWSSAMADHGLADYIGSGAQMRFAYHGVGLDTIVVTVSNAYGSATDTAVVRVCAVQDTLPYVADFGSDLPCWQVLDGTCSVHSSGYLSFEDWPTAVAMPPVWIPDDGNVVLEYECAYSFFYGSTMVMVTTDMVTFDTLSVIPFTNGTHPSTRIPLGAYAGQHIRVVFKATGQFLQYYLTSVQIRYANEPVVQAEADDGYFPGTPVTLTASLLEGDTVNLTYSWVSTMTQCGDATLTFDGGPQATLVPSVGGPDTVTVWATNNYGTDSATIVVNIKPCGVVDTLPWVEDFSNQFACWWQPAGSQWSPDNTGVMACVIKAATTGDNWLISRAIELPMLSSVEGEGMQLWWDAAAIFANGHTYSVWITTGDYRDTGSYTQLATYSGNLPTYNSGWRTPRVDLSAYAGDTVHLAFRYQTQYYEVSGIPGILAIDNVRILDTRPPQVAIIPPARCFVDDTVAYRANLIHGVRSSMNYTWHSSMALQGLADVYSVDTMLYVVYHAAGYDTVNLVATNAYGSDTARSVMTVKNCPAVTVPWYEDFEVVNPCWSGSWTPDYITYMWLDSTTHVMRSTPNSWYVSPWIDLPDTTGLQLMWNKNGSAANSFMKIFVSPTGSIEPADFTDTLLYGETPNGFDSLPLDAYAGRRIRVAFAQLASSNYSDSYVLDDVRVDYNRATPQVSLVAPLFASSFGDAITATATLGNIAQGVTYSWSSTFGVVTAMGAQCRISYTVAGEDTITVVASNPYGSDTALAVVTVYDCGSMTTVPFFEDFSNITTTTYRVHGWLPPCWNATWNGDTLGLAPHVITSGGYQWISNIPDNALLMQAGTSTGYGSLAEVVLPRFADSLHHLMMAFDYRFESANYGTLVVGYYDDTVFTAVDTLAGHAGNYRRDTVLFDMHFSANNPHIAIRWQYSGGSWFAVAIDNLEVYSISDLTPHATIGGPDTVTAYDTAHFVATLLQGDTIGLTYTWHSSLTGQSATGSHWPVVYTVVGIDTISVTIANLHGSQTLNRTVTVTGAPQVTVAGPTAVDTYDTLVYTASIVDGTSVGLTYTWHSTLMGSLTPYPSPNGEGSSVQLAYTLVGTDTLTVIAANACGADTASLVVEVNYVPQVGSPVVSVQGYQYATLCDTASFTVTLLEGDTTGLIYTWHSAKADRGEATLIPEGDRLKVTYSTIGFDTITVVASNNLGWRSVTATTRVLDCEVRDTPFEATLTDGGGNIYVHFLDWQRGSIAYPRGNLRSNVGWHPVDNSWSITLDGRNCMESHKSDYGDATGDHWLISPPIRLPENTVDTLAWNAYCDYTTYHVLLSPTEYVVQPDGKIDRSYFTDTIYSETGFNGWTRREVDLSAYAGRTIHLAFVHTGPASDATHISGYLAAIDTVWIWSNVGQDTVPVPPLPDTVWRSVMVTANVDGAPMPYGSGLYADSSMVEIGYHLADTAALGGHWEFLGWSDGVSGNPRDILVTSDTSLVALFEWIEDSVGINELRENSYEIRVYPNPAHGAVTVSVGAPATLTVLDLTGRVVVAPLSLSSSATLPFTDLPSGTYFLRVTTEEGTAVKKLIVK